MRLPLLPCALCALAFTLPAAHALARIGAAEAYEARFCLARRRDGNAVVHQIRDGERAGKRLLGCLPPGE
jgi:hypothetical protein